MGSVRVLPWEGFTPMNEHLFIECAKSADREILAVILVKNGYTVRERREKKGKSNTYVYYIEYWKGI